MCKNLGILKIMFWKQKQKGRFMMNKIVATLLLMIFIVGTITGCGANKTNEANNTPQSSITTDLVGNQIELPSKTEKIISISSSVTDILVALGVSDNLIAIDKYSAEIEGVSKDLVQFDLMKPDTEQIIALNPDIVFVTSMSNAGGDDVYKSVRDAGVCVVAVPSAASIDEIIKSIDFIGNILNTQEKSDEIIENMNSEIDKIKEISVGIQEKKTVYFEIGSSPKLYTLGKNTFINEMIEIVGAENVFSDQDSWITVSEEAVLTANPDVILTNVGYDENPVETIYARENWKNINAIKDKQVFFIEKNPSSLSSQNVIVALKQIAESVYPELY